MTSEECTIFLELSSLHVRGQNNKSERIMEENSMVRDLITKILDETGPTEGSSSSQSSDKAVSSLPPNSQYPKSDANTSFMPPYYQNYNYPQTEQNGFNYNLQNGFGNNFVNYPENDGLLGLETDSSSDVSPEQLNLLRLAAQEIGGAQFASPKYEEKYYNFFEPSQRNSLPETNMFPNNFNRNSLNLDMNYNTNYDNFNQRLPNKFDGFKEQNQDTELLAYLSQLNLNIERDREPNNMEFKMPLDNGHYQNEEYNKMQENKMFFNRNFPPPKTFNGEFYDQMSQMNDRTMNQFDYSNQTPNGNMSNMNFKPNGYHQNEFMGRRDMNVPREFQNGMNDRNGFNGDNQLMRQQELARQMSLLIRNRPPPNQLNVDVSFLPENAPFNIGLGGLLANGAPVLPSPMLDLPLLAPFYALRNMRGAATSSGILHLRLDACYEQWRQLERERKRTEARLALAYPGRAVSSSNSIPVPRLPPCPTRVDRLTVDMLREHTKVLTLMGKMETLRASVCVAQNKKPVKEDKITVLKRGENVEKEKELDPETFDPSSWKDDVNNLAEIAPHSEVESAMLSWRAAVGAVQAARRRELAQARHPRHDPILQLAEAVKQLCQCARRARAAMWSDLTLTVALAPDNVPHREKQVESPAQPQTQVPAAKAAEAVQVQAKTSQAQPAAEAKEEKPSNETQTKTDSKQDKKQTDKQQDKNQQRRAQYYRKVNQRDFYQKNHRYDNRFMHNRHPYYLATGPIN